MASSDAGSQRSVLGNFQNEVNRLGDQIQNFNHNDPFGELNSPIQSQHSLHSQSAHQEEVTLEEQMRAHTLPLQINTMQLPRQLPSRAYSVPLIHTPPPVIPSQFLPFSSLLATVQATNQFSPSPFTIPATNQFSPSPLIMPNLGQLGLNNQPPSSSLLVPYQLPNHGNQLPILDPNLNMQNSQAVISPRQTMSEGNPDTVISPRQEKSENSNISSEGNSEAGESDSENSEGISRRKVRKTRSERTIRSAHKSSKPRRKNAPARREANPPPQGSSSKHTNQVNQGQPGLHTYGTSIPQYPTAFPNPMLPWTHGFQYPYPWPNMTPYAGISQRKPAHQKAQPNSTNENHNKSDSEQSTRSKNSKAKNKKGTETINFKHYLQSVPMFSGKGPTGPITFFDELEAAFLANPKIWNEERKIQACKSKLEGVALKLTYSALSKNDSYQKLKQDILTLFSKDQVEKLTVQLQQATKEPSEDYLEFYARVKALAQSVSHFDPRFDEDRACALALLRNVNPILENELLKEFNKERLSSMKVMKIILDRNGGESTKKEVTTKPSYSESYEYQEPLTVAALNAHKNDRNYYSYNNLSSDPNYHKKNQSYKENTGHTYRSSSPSRNKSETQFMFNNKMPLPCSKCKEWGHNAYHCKGSGKNGASGRKYAPVYCTNCEEWTWHGRKNRHCPANQSKYYQQDTKTPKAKRD